MIKNFTRLPQMLARSFKQARYSTYVHNNLTWTQDYPDLALISSRELNVDDLYSEVRDKKVKYLNELSLPYNFKGTKSFKPIKRNLDNAVLNEKKIDLEKVDSKLKIYLGRYFKALSTGDPKDLPPCESNFLVNFLHSYRVLQNSGFKLELMQSAHELKEKGLSEKIEIFETMHIMGLNVERAKNFPIDEYNLDRAAEGRGLLRYMFKEKEKSEKESEEFKGAQEEYKNILREQNHPSVRGYRAVIPELQFILRIYAQYTSSYKIVPMQGKEEVLGLDDYTFKHVAIFENQLRFPPPTALAYKSIEEMVGFYRLQEWKLVDFDGVLHGNPLLVDRAVHSKLLHLKPE